jgi:hypothetical protein
MVVFVENMKLNAIEWSQIFHIALTGLISPKLHVSEKQRVHQYYACAHTHTHKHSHTHTHAKIASKYLKLGITHFKIYLLKISIKVHDNDKYPQDHPWFWWCTKEKAIILIVIVTV